MLIIPYMIYRRADFLLLVFINLGNYVTKNIENYPYSEIVRWESYRGENVSLKIHTFIRSCPDQMCYFHA